MELTRYENVQAFAQAALPYLLQDEATHNLMLGLIHILEHHPERYPEPPYLALVSRSNEVVAAALRTPPHNLILSRVTDEGALPLLAADVRRHSTPVPGVFSLKPTAEVFVALWQEMTGQRAQLSMAERVYRLEQVIPVTGVKGSLRQATQADRELLVRWTQAFKDEALPGEVGRSAETTVAVFLEMDSLFVWQDGEVVSIAAWGGLTPNGVRVSLVYTPPEHRRRGYASACVAALSQHLLDGGRRFCFLFTNLTNPTSNSIYQKIGYTPVCDMDQYRFEVQP